MKKTILSKKQLSKVVRTTQALEGYEPASKEVKEKTKKLMKKYNIKVSKD